MLTKKQYIEFLISTPLNYTCTNLAAHRQTMSHDVVSDFLRRERFTPGQLWELVQNYISDSSDSFLIVDDSVQDKRYSRFIALVKKQYSGNEHGLVKGIGIVNMVHSSGKEGDFYPIDYRLYPPEVDGKTKNEHFQQMFTKACGSKNLKARKILFDCWYASVDNLKLIHPSGWTFLDLIRCKSSATLL